MKSFRYIYGAVYIAGAVYMNIMNEVPLWGKVLISALLLVLLVGNEFQIQKKAKTQKAQQDHASNSVQDKVFRAYRERI